MTRSPRPLIGLLLWLMMDSIGGDDADPSFRILIAVIGLLWDDPDAALFVWVGGLCFVMGLAVIATAWLSGSALLARRGRTGELWISSMGVLRRPGRYSALAPTGPLTDVALVAGPPMRVVFSSTVRSGAYGATQQHNMADILVPAGREGEGEGTRGTLQHRADRQRLTRRLRSTTLIRRPEAERSRRDRRPSVPGVP